MMISKIKQIVKKLIVFRKTILYSGSSVFCEICGFNAKSFKEQRCVKCDSLPRTRLIPYSIKFFKIKNLDNFLHIAPNIQEYNYVLKNLNYKVYDRLNIVPANHVNLIDDITNSKIKDNAYSFILIWHVFEHIPDDKKAIAELFRILQAGGKLLVSVPIYPIFNPTTYEDITIKQSDYLKTHGHYDHCRSCGLDYYKRFEEVGFTTSELHTKDLDQTELKRYGLKDSHTVWMFQKN